MLTRRDFLRTTLISSLTGAAAATRNLWAAGRLAWPKPIGLELYTVRNLLPKNPLGTLKAVAAVGYKELELGLPAPPSITSAKFKSYEQETGLKLISGFLPLPKTVDDWKKGLDEAAAYGVTYTACSNVERIDADAWKRMADLFNECGRLSKPMGIQFTYHNHIREFERLGNTDGYEILLTRCDPDLVKMEMDIFWITYSGRNPLPYFKRFPGRFPLLHIKDLKKGITVNPDKFPGRDQNPFTEVGQGRIDWPKIFAHVGQAGAKHIFVEQDECDVPPLEAIKISYQYLKNLRLS
jgi:sugar phosphate isomerase/epimerase